MDKRIQEDNLQHLALFSEYGRLALGEESGVDQTVGGTRESSHGGDSLEGEVS